MAESQRDPRFLVNSEHLPFLTRTAVSEPEGAPPVPQMFRLPCMCLAASLLSLGCVAMQLIDRLEAHRPQPRLWSCASLFVIGYSALEINFHDVSSCKLQGYSG